VKAYSHACRAHSLEDVYIYVTLENCQTGFPHSSRDGQTGQQVENPSEVRYIRQDVTAGELPNPADIDLDKLYLSVRT
jgi:hypothetical protein